MIDLNYEVHILSRQEWQHNNILLNDDVVCSTDGSRITNQARASVFNSTDRVELSLPLHGELICSVFQAEVYAILQYYNVPTWMHFDVDIMDLLLLVRTAKQH